MLNKTVTFTSTELNTSGTINLKEVYDLSVTTHTIWDHTGTNVTERTETYKYPLGMLISNSCGTTVDITLLNSGEAAAYTESTSGTNTPIRIANSTTWFPNYLYPLPRAYKVWARVASGSASSDLNIIFVNYSD